MRCNWRNGRQDTAACSKCRQHTSHVVSASMTQAFVFNLCENRFEMWGLYSRNNHMVLPWINFCPGPARCFRHFWTVENMERNFSILKSVELTHIWFNCVQRYLRLSIPPKNLPDFGVSATLPLFCLICTIELDLNWSVIWICATIVNAPEST